MDHPESILFVAGDEQARASFARRYAGSRYRLHIAADGAAALEVLAAQRIDFALVAWRLGAAESGIDLIARIAAAAQPPRAVALVAPRAVDQSLYTAAAAVDAEPVPEPVDESTLLLAWRRATRAPFPLMKLDRWVRDILRKTVEKCGGNQSRAAKVLGIDRRTIQRTLGTSRHDLH